MLRQTTKFCTAILCFSISGLAVAQQTTLLDAAGQGEGNKGTFFRPVDSMGNPAFFGLTARSSVDKDAPFDPNAAGDVGTVVVDKDDKGTGVQDDGGGGSKGISGGGGAQDETLIFTFDGPIPASSVILDLGDIEFGNVDDKDDPVLFLSVAGSGIFGLTVQEAELQNAFTSTGDKRGRIDFALLTSLPAGLQIDAFKLRETNGHIAVTKIVNAVGIDGACCNDSDGSCVVTAQTDCGAGNTYQGDGTVCSPNPCTPPPACCFSDGSCIQVSEISCGALGGTSFPGQLCTDIPSPCVVPPPGACCLPDDTCQQDVTEADCTQLEGQFFANTDCADPTLPCMIVACCLDNNVCQDITRISCEVLGGGGFPGSTCANNPPCDEVSACCLPDDTCRTISQESCIVVGGTFFPTRECNDPELPCNMMVACCLGNNECQDISQLSCDDLGGAGFPSRTCADNPPPCEDVSACCLPDGSCENISESSCAALGGQFFPDQECDDAACPVPCCFDNCPCELLSPEVCEARGGTPQLGAQSCEDAGCQITPCGDGDPCTEDVCVDGRCQFIPIDNPTPCCLPDGMCQVLPCAEACEAVGGMPTDSCNGSTTVSLLPTAVFRTPVTICGGGAASCPAAMTAMIVGLASLRIGNRRRRRRVNR